MLARSLDHRHRHQVLDRGIEQSLGYAAAMGTIVMDELAPVCGRAEVRFTGVRTDLGIVENDIAIMRDQVRGFGEWLDGHDIEVRRMRSNRVAIQDEVDQLRAMVHEMRQDIGTLVHVNQMMHASLVDLTLSCHYSRDNPIVIDDKVDSVMEVGPAPEVLVEGCLVPIEDVEEGELVSESSEESEGVWEIAQEEFEQGVDTWATLGARAYGNRCLHVGNISGFGRKFFQCSDQIHFIHISNVMSTCASNVIADNISFTFEM